MTTEIIFPILTLVLLVAAFSISIYHRHRAERQGGQLDKSDRPWLLIVLRLCGLALILPLLGYLINPDWVAWARIPLPDWLRWAAVALALPMLAGIYWLFSTIGNNISPKETTRSDHQLVTRGPYRWIRHPLYTFGTLFFLALALISGLWWLAVGLLILFPVLAWRTPQEEANLVAHFGDDYRAYMQRTGRYLPRLSSLHS